MTARDARDVAEVKRALREAFSRAPELAPRAEFSDRLRSRLLEAAVRDGRPPRVIQRRWFALAAGVVLAAALGGAAFLNRSAMSADALVLDAIGDHQKCGLKLREVGAPVPLEDAAQQIDSAFRLLLDAPPDDTQLPSGSAHVVERHACAYNGRPFGHVVLRYDGRTVSLLMTADEGMTNALGTDETPHLIGRSANGLSVVAVTRSRHAILLVSDLGSAELTELSRAVSVPLARRVEAHFIPEDHSALASLLIAQRPTE